jgi:RimJ/RimL family protein N-acetyltransferase
VDTPPKLRYQIDLTRPVPAFTSEDAEIRSITENDLDVLANLMLDAYIGTIDYEGETLQEAVGEVESYFDGEPMIEHSFAASIDGEIASTVLVLLWQGGPFIGYARTVPAYKNKGLGRLLVAATMTSLHQVDHTHLTLFITEGNTPSEAMFKAVGAVQVPPT